MPVESRYTKSNNIQIYVNNLKYFLFPFFCLSIVVSRRNDEIIEWHQLQIRPRLCWFLVVLLEIIYGVWFVIGPWSLNGKLTLREVNQCEYFFLFGYWEAFWVDFKEFLSEFCLIELYWNNSERQKIFNLVPLCHLAIYGVITICKFMKLHHLGRLKTLFDFLK